MRAGITPAAGFDAAGAAHAIRAVGEFVRDGQPAKHNGDLLRGLLRFLLKWRSTTVGEHIKKTCGASVMSGPFTGMAYASISSEGALAPKLLGTYEAELHPFLRAARAKGVSRVIDVGCAEGYYAVGLARYLPQARVEAYDIDPAARTLCAAMAAANGVADRVEVRERFDLASAGEIGAGTLVIVDTEGAEAEILGEGAPERLRAATVIVETHPFAAPGITETLAARFAPTHEVILVRESYKPPPPGLLPPDLPQHDLFAATWEWRATQTPWLVMRPRG